MNLTLRAQLCCEQGGVLSVMLLDEAGEQPLTQPATIGVRPGRRYLPYEFGMAGSWLADAERATFAMSCSRGTVSCDRLVLMEGSPAAPTPVQTRLRLVNRDAPEPYPQEPPDDELSDRKHCALHSVAGPQNRAEQEKHQSISYDYTSIYAAPRSRCCENDLDVLPWRSLSVYRMSQSRRFTLRHTFLRRRSYETPVASMTPALCKAFGDTIRCLG